MNKLIYKNQLADNCGNENPSHGVAIQELVQNKFSICENYLQKVRT